VVELPWAADSCPWVEKLRTVLPFTDGIALGGGECMQVFCRNTVWDHPYRGSSAFGATSEFFISASGTRPSFSGGPGPFFVSGDECLATIGIDVWSAGADLVFILAGFG
jgi:hypothetical protein